MVDLASVLHWSSGRYRKLGAAVEFLALLISIFLIAVRYFGWMGGADVRILIGLWGLWPLVGFLSLVSTGI